MCLLFETIKVVDGEVCFLDYHQRRVDRSIGSGRFDLLRYVSGFELPDSGCFKLRITYSDHGVVEHTLTPYVMRNIETLRLITDNSILYDCKWNDRSAIDRLLDLRNGCDDVLIARQGLITDCSFANVVFLDGDRWVTPDQPLLAGTCRERLIEQGVIVEERVTVQLVARYSKLMLINAMIDFDPNRTVPVSNTHIVEL